MLIKEVVRHKVLGELIAEQVECILNQHAQITEMEKEIKSMRAELEKLNAPKEE